MKRLLTGAVLSLLFLSVIATGAQNATSAKKTSAQNANKTRGPIFRATADQVKQAQGILKERGFYGGEKTGKLDDQSREGLRKYQQAEGVKITGTLNKVTLVKMGIPLTDKQKTM